MQPRLAGCPTEPRSLVACSARRSPPGQPAGSRVWWPVSASTQQPYGEPGSCHTQRVGHRVAPGRSRVRRAPDGDRRSCARPCRLRLTRSRAGPRCRHAATSSTHFSDAADARGDPADPAVRQLGREHREPVPAPAHDAEIARASRTGSAGGSAPSACRRAARRAPPSEPCGRPRGRPAGRGAGQRRLRARSAARARTAVSGGSSRGGPRGRRRRRTGRPISATAASARPRGGRRWNSAWVLVMRED